MNLYVNKSKKKTKNLLRLDKSVNKWQTLKNMDNIYIYKPYIWTHRRLNHIFCTLKAIHSKILKKKGKILY